MPEYLSPGVYVEELDAGPHPIQAVSTSTTGMVGVTARGPTTGKPTLITSFGEFQRTFGGFLPEPLAGSVLLTRWADDPDEGGRWWLFPYAVQGFFDNGGQRLYVKRVAAHDAGASSGDFQGGLVSAVTSNAKQGDTEIALEHLVGIQNGSQVTILYRDPASQATQPVGVDAYDALTGRITLNNPLAHPLRAGRDLVQVKAPAAPLTLQVIASAPGAWGDAIRVLVRPVVSTLSLLADPNEGDPFRTQVAAHAAQDSATVNVLAVPGLAVGPPAVPPGGFFVQIGPRTFQVDSIGPVAGHNDQVELTLHAPHTHRPWDPPLAVQRVRRATTAPGTTLRVGGAARLYPGAIVELDTGTTKQTLRVQSVVGDVVTFTTNANADYFETHKLRLVELQVSVSYTDERGRTTDEQFTNLRLTQDDQTGLTRINGRSQLVAVAQPSDLADPGNLLLPTSPSVVGTGVWLTLGGGADNYDSLHTGDFVGVDGGSGNRTGIQALEDIDEVAICAVPGVWSGTVQSSLIQHCEFLKDRFAILDPRDRLGIEDVRTFRDRFDTKYAALYQPWLVVRDVAADRDVQVPPSGHMAGVYARVDVERGVHKAPANVVIRGIRPRTGQTGGLAQDITKREQDLLNPRGINALRFFPEFGQRVWGARTLSSDTTWKYVNVRRLFIQVEESLDEGLQWVVFEPNDEPLWALVRQTITNFLTTIWRTGALAGTTADEAFFVHCDHTTMSRDDIANGRLICVVGIAPVFPAEFVIIRVEQKTLTDQQT